MTTIAYKDGIIAADSQVSLGSLICNNDFNKVQRFDSQEFGSVYVGAAGTLSHICEMFDFIGTLFSGEDPDAIKFGSEHFQVVMLTEDGELKEGLLTESSTNILWIDCEQPYAIGSGSHIAIGAMAAGATAEEAVKLASKHDCYTNDNVKVYSYKDLSYVNLLKQQRDYLDQQIGEFEAEQQAKAFIDQELEECPEFDVEDTSVTMREVFEPKDREDTSGHEYQLGAELNNSCINCEQCQCKKDSERQFQKGDLVRVISLESGGEDYIGYESWIEIVDTEDNSYMLESGWWYGSEELELVKPATDPDGDF